jgi:hypothetical protein
VVVHTQTGGSQVAKPKAVEADKGKLGSSDVKLVGISNTANSP